MGNARIDSHPPAHDLQYLIRLVLLAAALLALLFGPGALFATESASDDARASYIVQGVSSKQAAALVVEVGGKVTHELKIIRAVGALLTGEQRDTLAEHPEVQRIWRDREAEVQATRLPSPAMAAPAGPD